MIDVKIFFLLLLIYILFFYSTDTNNKDKNIKQYNKRIDNMTKYELDCYIRNKGLNEYQEYESTDILKQKLKDRYKYFN